MGFEKLLRAIGLYSTVLVLFVACSGGSAGTSGTNPGSNGSITASGGTVSVVDPNSPIVGSSVTVPSGAVGVGAVRVSIGFQDALPGPLRREALNAGALVLSKTIILEKDQEGTFFEPVQVTVPYDSSKLGDRDVPTVLYWNEVSGSYDPVTVLSFDRLGGKVTFQTVHFSSYIVVGIRNLIQKVLGDLQEEDVGFRPSADGFFIRNFGSYSSPEGNCLGMAAFSDWFFESNQNNGVGLFTYQLLREGDVASPEDDLKAREIVVRAHDAASQYWGKLQTRALSSLSQVNVGLTLILNLKLLGKPQIMTMLGNASFSPAYNPNEKGMGHAVVVWRYTPTDKKFWFYDSNVPGTVPESDQRAIGFDPEQGFTVIPETGNYTPPPDTFGYDALGSVYGPGDMQALLDGALRGWDQGEYGKINVTHVQYEASSGAISVEPLKFDAVGRVASVTQLDRVRLIGDVIPAGGTQGYEPTHIKVLIDGKETGVFQLDGTTFDFPLPVLSHNKTLTNISIIAFAKKVLEDKKKSYYGTYRQFQIAASELLGPWSGTYNATTVFSGINPDTKEPYTCVWPLSGLENLSVESVRINPTTEVIEEFSGVGRRSNDLLVGLSVGCPSLNTGPAETAFSAVVGAVSGNEISFNMTVQIRFSDGGTTTTRRIGTVSGTTMNMSTQFGGSLTGSSLILLTKDPS